MNTHELEHWNEFQMMRELKLTNKNRWGGLNWKEFAEKYHSIGELGNFGFDLLEICIINISQNEKTFMGIAENSWMIDAVGHMVDKVTLAAIQICGLKDDVYNKNVTRRDGEDIMRA
jgi:hypothetical protein